MAETIHVVVADPDGAIRTRVAGLVSDAAAGRHEVEVHEAHDGTQVLDMVAEHEPALIISEVLLDKTNGLAMLRRLPKRRGGEPPPPVIFVTSMSRDFDRYWALRLGAHGYVMKPFDDASLRDRIERVLDDGSSAKPERPTLLP